MKALVTELIYYARHQRAYFHEPLIPALKEGVLRHF